MEVVREVLRHEPAPVLDLQYTKAPEQQSTRARSRPPASLAIDICRHLLLDRLLPQI